MQHMFMADRIRAPPWMDRVHTGQEANSAHTWQSNREISNREIYPTRSTNSF